MSAEKTRKTSLDEEWRRNSKSNGRVIKMSLKFCAMRRKPSMIVKNEIVLFTSIHNI